MTYITIARTRDSKTLYSAASRLCKEMDGAVVFRRGTKSIVKVVEEARRHGHRKVLLVCREGRRQAQRTILISGRSYRWGAST